ncbi:MAG: exodeoxyribonuclease VII large subunit [Myxococcota bacterium]|jgi:exodeoxyribonuclease VII large subunit
MRQYSVQALMDEIGRGISERYPRVMVEAEVAQLTVAASGHAYILLREPGTQRAAATLSAVCWKSSWRGLSSRPKPGDRVVVRGKLSVYAQRGSVQLSVIDIQPAGAGALAKQIAERIARLTADGLLDPSRKKPLPKVPKIIGLVASPTSAAVQDFLRVSRERFPATRILLSPAVTQGAEAPSSVVRALDLLQEDGRSEIVVVTRGGGSKEDLMAFQDEQLARFVAAFPIPVVSAVGHQIDTTLIDLVADVAVPTPTAAAVEVLPDGAAMSRSVDEVDALLHAAIGRRVVTERSRLAALRARLRHPGQRLMDVRKRRDELVGRLQAVMARRLTDERADVDRQWTRIEQLGGMAVKQAAGRLAAQSAALQAMSPLAVLSRGYSVVTTDSGVLSDVGDVGVGDTVTVRLARGRLQATVASAHSDELA